MKILVRAPNWIGDQILAYPFFHYLRESYPHARITVACVEWVRAIQFRNLVDDVIVLPRAYRPGFWERFDVTEKSADLLRRAGPWDLALSLPNSLSSAWMIFRAGAELRRGFKSDGRGFLLNQGVDWEPASQMHRAEAYVSLLSRENKSFGDVKLFWGEPPANDLDPGIAGVLPKFDALKAWPDSEPIDPPSEPYWILAPGANAEARRWSIENFAELAQLIARQTGWTGLIVGGPAEAAIAEKLLEFPLVKLKDRTAQGSVTAYWKLFASAKFTVSNDSGLAHVASLCGSPLQITWGAGDPRRTEPLGPGKVKIQFNPVDCWPCVQNTCERVQGTKLECLSGVHPGAVWNEIQVGLLGKPNGN